MGCWGTEGDDPAATVGVCPECDQRVDVDGDSTGANCCYSPVCCEKCGYQPCDGSC